MSSECERLRLVEALLFAAAEPMSEEALAQVVGDEADIGGLLGTLAAHYAERGVNLVRRGAGWMFATAPDLGKLLRQERQVVRTLSRAAVETLAVIAYHQPVTRAEIEAIRGVALGRGTLDRLVEAGWVRPKGRREVPGRPLNWVTTSHFLAHFGLDDLTELPGVEELRAAGLLEIGPVVLGDGAAAPDPEADAALPETESDDRLQ